MSLPVTLETCYNATVLPSVIKLEYWDMKHDVSFNKNNKRYWIFFSSSVTAVHMLPEWSRQYFISSVTIPTLQLNALMHSGKTVQYNAVQCSLVQCSSVHCSRVQCIAVQYSAVQCNAVFCSAVQCSEIQFSLVQCSAVQWTACMQSVWTTKDH